MNLIDTELAAIILGVDPRQVRRFVEQGKLLNLGDARAMRFEVMEVHELARVRKAAS
jgi:hypothetical protein